MLKFEDAQAALMGHQAAYTEATEELAILKNELDSQRAKLIAQGIEGKNADERESRLKLALADHYNSIYQAEITVTQKRLEMELARLEWDGLRYQLRAFDIATRMNH